MKTRTKKHIHPTHSNYTPERETSIVGAVPNPQFPESMLGAANVIYKYGIPRSAALNMLHNYWVIKSGYQELFSTYYLLHWEAGYFQQKMVDGMIEREGVSYQVIYHRCDSYGIGRRNNQLLLSFRSLKPEYEATPTVLVTIA